MYLIEVNRSVISATVFLMTIAKSDEGVDYILVGVFVSASNHEESADNVEVSHKTVVSQ